MSEPRSDDKTAEVARLSTLLKFWWQRGDELAAAMWTLGGERDAALARAERAEAKVAAVEAMCEKWCLDIDTEEILAVMRDAVADLELRGTA